MARHSKISEIFTDARYKLADPDGKSWSNARLLSLLNNGIRNIVYNTELLKAETYVLLVEGQQKYDISDLAIKITRVDFESKSITFKTHADLDNLNIDWDLDTSSKIKHIIYDKSDRGVFKVYPRPEKLVTNVISSPYGIITAIDTVYDITYYGETLQDLPNDIVNNGTMKIYYVKNPDKYTIDDLENEIILDDIWDDILVHWIVGTALKDDRDEQNRVIGADNLKEYTEKLSTAKAGAVSEFTASKGRTTYNGGFQ